MAFIICPKHGAHGAAAVCEHVAAKVIAHDVEQSAGDERLFPVRVSFEQVTLGPTWLCADCARLHGVSAGGLELSGDDGLEQFWNVIGFTPVCPMCFDERYGQQKV